LAQNRLDRDAEALFNSLGSRSSVSIAAAPEPRYQHAMSTP
jgi:hypothetical protein